jgi:predicted nucleotidyltransferase
MVILTGKEEKNPNIIKAIDILKRYGASKAVLFGSVQKDPSRTSSDLDLAIDGVEDVCSLESELEMELGVTVDLIPCTESPRFDGRIILWRW